MNFILVNLLYCGKVYAMKERVMIGPRTKQIELSVNEEIEILSAEIEVEYLEKENEFDEYHIIFTEE